MRKLVLLFIITMMMGLTSSQYPNCVSCPNGSIPLLPLSYNTVKPNMYNGIQPSTAGCTNGASSNGEIKVDCKQDTTLINCDQGFNGDYSNLSNVFAWNRTMTTLEFKFDQQININKISMFFWNSPSNNIMVPNVTACWADHNMRFTVARFTTNLLADRNNEGMNVLNMSITDNKFKFQYLKLVMSFNGDSKWMFLSKVQFCGDTAPFYITQPSYDDYVQIVSPTATMVNLMCSLNITIPSSVIVVWTHNRQGINSSRITQTGNSTTLVIRNLQPSDAGVYQCAFHDTSESLWIITRNIVVNITDHAVDSPTSTLPVNTMAVASPANSDSNNVVVIVTPIIVFLLLIIIVTIVVIVVFFWRKKRKSYHVHNDGAKLTKQSSYNVDIQAASSSKGKKKKKTNKTSTPQNNECYNQEPPLLYALPGNNEKKKGLEQSNSNLSQNQALSSSLINSNNGQTIEFDIYANVQEHSRDTHSRIDSMYSIEDSSICLEAINPSAIAKSLSQDQSSLDDVLCPFGSVYADPLPLVKSERPPIVSGKNIRPLRPLGVGQFGEVILAKTVGLSSRYLGIGNSNDSSVSMKVAVKTLKSALSDESRKSFEKEIKFMSRLKDDNVVRLLGICTTDTPFIMMEYMENGDLNNYLQKYEFTYDTDKLLAANKITLNALIYISFQIASGMEYLSSHKFVHRDLAARNVLVGANYTVKIADFGMSQNMYNAYYCKISGRKVLPIRWMACECFFGKFSIQTDVWSFGITLWEIFTLCRERPFDDLSDQEMIDDAIKGPDRRIPEQPDICPNDVYCIMESCLRHEPSERAKFGLLCDQLNEFYTKIL